MNYTDRIIIAIKIYGAGVNVLILVQESEKNKKEGLIVKLII